MTELVKYETMDDLERLGRAMVSSGYFSDASKISQAVVKILAGKEMGFGPIASMNGIHVIKGKPAVGANLMAAKVKAHPKYDYRVKKLTDAECVIAFYQEGQEIGESSFTDKDATKAGTQNMGKFPRNMLFARAMSNGVRWFCPDVFLGGPVYTPDELGAIVDDEGTIIEMPTITVEAPQTPEPPADLDYDGELIDDTQLAADIAHAGEVVARVKVTDEIDDTPFTTPEAAIQWGVTSGAFTHGAHSKNAYNKLKAEAQPKDARQMAKLWREDVARRLAEQEAQA